MLNRIQINDYRCLRRVDVPLKPLTVLIGPNNTGKSAFLSAIQLLGATPTENSVSIAPTDFWRFDRSTSPTITAYTSGGGEVRLEPGPGGKKSLARKGDITEIVPVSFFDSGLFPAMQSHGAEGSGSIPRIDDKASNVPAFLDALLRKDRETFNRVLDSLKALIPGLENLNIETPLAANRRIDLKFESGFVMHADQASYGVRLMIFFVALANHPDPPRTILLEEPESGVHPKRLEDIVSLLVGLSEGKLSGQKTQVILTTHSPYLVDCIDPEKHQVLVFQRGPEGACIARPVDTDRLKLFLSEFMLGEVWLNQDEAGLVQKVQ